METAAPSAENEAVLDRTMVASMAEEASRCRDVPWPAQAVVDLATQLLAALDEVSLQSAEIESRGERIERLLDRVERLRELIDTYDPMIQRYREEKAALSKEIDELRDQAVLQHRERRKLADRLEKAEARR